MKLLSIAFPRRLVQFGCAIAFAVIPFMNRAEITLLSGNLLAFNFAGLPLGDPLAALQVMLSSWPMNANMLVAANMLIGALIALGIAFLLGPVFCSWLCPYGLLSELTRDLSRKLRKNEAVPAKEAGAERNIWAKAPKRAQTVAQSPFMGRLFVALLGVVLAATIVPFPVLNQLSMPGWYTRTLQHIPLDTPMVWGGALFLSAVLTLEFILRKRLWCRYICPQSVLIALAGMLFPKRLQVAFKPKSCTCPASDRACGKVCSLALDPRHPGWAAQRAQCTNCGDCVDACRNRGNALALRFGKEKI